MQLTFRYRIKDKHARRLSVQAVAVNFVWNYLNEVSERLTTQTCSECGCLPHSRPRGIAGLRIREWVCDDCGAIHDRDVNAAKNILRIGLDTLVEGACSLKEAPPFREGSSHGVQ